MWTCVLFSIQQPKLYAKYALLYAFKEFKVGKKEKKEKWRWGRQMFVTSSNPWNWLTSPFGQMQGVYLSKYQKCTRAFLLFIGNLKWQKEFGTAPLNILRTSDISFFLSFFLSKSLLDTCLLLKKERKTDRQK